MNLIQGGLQAALDDVRAGHAGKRLTLWFMDEARFGQKGRVCHRWFTVSGAFGPFSGPLDDQPLFAAAQRQGISSSMRLWGQPLTRRVSTSRK
jgi:hypothetical protein